MRFCTLALALFFLESAAFAQPSSPKASQLADKLFSEGRALVERGDCPNAIPKFEESLRTEASVGGFLNLGDCQLQQKHFDAAYRAYDGARRLAAGRNDPRVQEAQKRVSTLEASAFKIIVAAESSAGAAFRVDGDPVEYASLSGGYLVAPGKHTISGVRDGMTWAANPEGAAGSTATLVVTFKRPDPAAPPAPTPGGPTLAPTPEPSASTWSTQKTIGLVTGGVGVAGLAIGSVFGVLAMGANSDLKGVCPNYECPIAKKDDAENTNSKLKTDATLSTVFFISGGVLAAAGAVIYFTAPSNKESTALRLSPTIGKSTAGLLLGGTW